MTELSHHVCLKKHNAPKWKSSVGRNTGKERNFRKFYEDEINPLNYTSETKRHKLLIQLKKCSYGALKHKKDITED